MSERAAQLHASPWQGVLLVTGGGSLLLSEMLTTPGASATVLEARVPYAEAALADVLGRAPEQACSADTARALAMAAFQRARALGASQPFGLGCTASLATGRPKRGPHRAHVAVQTEAATWGAEMQFDGARAEEERELLELLWHALAAALELPLPAEPPAPTRVALTAAQQHWRQLILGERLAFATRSHDGRLLLPGAFNPLHHAHERMLAIAEEQTGLAGAFELSIVNVDKPLLDYTGIHERLRQFSHPVWLTRLPTFLEKARYFPAAWFAVGVDTLIRIMDARYYGSENERDRALAELAELETRFLVFGRRIDDRYLGLETLELPSALRPLCEAVPRARFDEPISSTELRRRR